MNVPDDNPLHYEPPSEGLRLIAAAICAQAILADRIEKGESHANIAREALGVADALLIHMRG